jgi:hypothetical protein
MQLNEIFEHIDRLVDEVEPTSITIDEEDSSKAEKILDEFSTYLDFMAPEIMTEGASPDYVAGFAEALSLVTGHLEWLKESKL